MDKGYRLLERIELDEGKNSFEKVLSHKHYIESIHLHLGDLLNTHAGNAMINQAYGLPDFNDVLAKKSNIIREIKANIKESIERFEPRITQVNVKYLPLDDNPLKLNFAICGEINHNGENVPLSIDVSVGVDGQFNV